MLLKSWLDDGCLCSSFKEIFLYTSFKSINPLIPSYWNVQKNPLIHFQWNHFGHSSYDQRYPRKVQLLFLEHFYFCFWLCCLLWLFPSLVDVINGVFGDGPEGLKTRKNKASSPLTMFERPFYACLIAPYYSMHRNHVEVVTTLVAFVTFLLKLASSMTLPSYEGYAGGSR